MNGVDKACIFLLLITAYIVLGLAETVIFMKRRFVDQRQQRLAQSAAVAATTVSATVNPPEEAPPGPGVEEEVLRVLGAFDATEEDAESPSTEATGEPPDAAAVRQPKQA